MRNLGEIETITELDKLKVINDKVQNLLAPFGKAVEVVR